jgi:hypothetical protein
MLQTYSGAKCPVVKGLLKAVKVLLMEGKEVREQ